MLHVKCPLESNSYKYLLLGDIKHLQKLLADTQAHVHTHTHIHSVKLMKMVAVEDTAAEKQILALKFKSSF